MRNDNASLYAHESAASGQVAPAPVHNIMDDLDDDILDNKKRWTKDMVEIYDKARSEIKRLGYADKESEKIAASVIVALSLQCGGKGLYLPMGERIRVAMRDKQLYDAFDGKNIPELQMRFKLSQQQIYKILKRQRQYEIDKRHDAA